jgi:hypothetical protein
MKNTKILSEERLENLIKKLETLPIDKWEVSTDSDSYEPHPDSPECGYKKDYVRYKTNLSNFGVTLERELHLDINQYINYTLSLSKEGGCLDKVTKSGDKNDIKKLFDKIDKDYKLHQELKKEEEENNIIKGLELAVK